MKRKLSSFTSVIPAIGDFFIGLQRQTNGSYKNSKIAFGDLVTGQVLLGKLTGFNLNPIQTVQYTNLAGGTFQPGDFIVDRTTGNAGIVFSDNGIDSMVIHTMFGPYGNGNSFDNGNSVSANFAADYYIPEEEILLINNGLVTDIRIDNASDTVSVASNIYFSHTPNRGSKICESGGPSDALQSLYSNESFISGILNKLNPSSGDIKYTLYNNRPDRRTKTSDKIYVSVIGEGTDKTCDIYIYGYPTP